MSSNLNLYRVTVTQEWSAEGTALVWAPDQKTAEKWAEVELNVLDADDNGTYSRSKPEPIDADLPDRIDDDALWLIMPIPGRPNEFTTVEADEFQALLSPERLEAIRLARIEAGNGQLPLLEVAC
jgi:hypothetical protein